MRLKGWRRGAAHGRPVDERREQRFVEEGIDGFRRGARYNDPFKRGRSNKSWSLGVVDIPQRRRC